jgi:hypothetical protein
MPPPLYRPFPDPQNANPHLRWHPLRGEWVTYAAYRQNRTFLPPPEYNPLAVTRPGDNPTEVPAGDYDIAVFDNRFPSLALDAHDPPAALVVPTAPADGRCEVVVFTQDPKGSLANLPLAHRAAAAGLGRPHAAHGRARPADPVRAAVREPRRRSRRDAAPSARPDLRLSLGAAGAGAHAQEQAEHHAKHGASLLSRCTSRARRRRRSACCTRRTRSPSCRPAPAIRTRCGCADPRRWTGFAHLSDAVRGRPGARAEDRAAEIRRPVAAALSLPDGLVPGAHRRRRRIPRRTCTRSSGRRTARATG